MSVNLYSTLKFDEAQSQLTALGPSLRHKSKVRKGQYVMYGSSAPLGKDAD